MDLHKSGSSLGATFKQLYNASFRKEAQFKSQVINEDGSKDSTKPQETTKNLLKELEASHPIMYIHH